MNTHMPDTAQIRHHDGGASTIHTLPLIQASGVANVLAMPPVTGNPYRRSVALVVNRTDLYPLVRLLSGWTSQDKDLNALAPLRAAITANLEG